MTGPTPNHNPDQADTTPPPPTTATWAHIAAHLTGLAHIATCSADGQPHVAVVAPLIEDDIVWVFARRASTTATNLRQNPRLSMMWQPTAEVYVHGHAEPIEDLDDRRRLWLSPHLAFDPVAFFHHFDHPDFALLKVTPIRATLLHQGGQLRWKR